MRRKKVNHKKEDSVRELLSAAFLIFGFIFVLYGGILLSLYYFLNWTDSKSSHFDKYSNKCVKEYQVVSDSNTENPVEASFKLSLNKSENPK